MSGFLRTLFKSELDRKLYKISVSHWDYNDADLGRILEVDEFIAELWQVHLKVKEEGYVQVCSYYQT